MIITTVTLFAIMQNLVYVNLTYCLISGNEFKILYNIWQSVIAHFGIFLAEMTICILLCCC